MSEGTIKSSDKRWLERRLVNKPRVMGIEEFCIIADEIPEFWINDIDESYRDGFEDGFDYAIDQFEMLYRKKGFVRVREICNMLTEWSEKILRPWRYFGNGKHRNHHAHHPQYTHEKTWAEIRKVIIRRDRNCQRCGDVIQLEVDHIIEVQDGGLPVSENLQTLCRTCHKGKLN